MVDDKHLGRASFFLQLQSQLLLNGGIKTRQGVIRIVARAASFRLQLIGCPSQSQIVSPRDSSPIEHGTICNKALKECGEISHSSVRRRQLTRQIADAGNLVGRPCTFVQVGAALCGHDLEHGQVPRFMVSREVEAICQEILHHLFEIVRRWPGWSLRIADKVKFLGRQPLGPTDNFLLLNSEGILEQID